MHLFLVSAGAFWLASCAAVILGLHFAIRRWDAAERRSWADARAIATTTLVARSAADVSADFRQWEIETKPTGV
jgi:hypothetical protein